MIWLNPSALFALAAVAAPILIHLLIQRRAERIAFPTLRFLQPTRLAAIRRHLLEDLPLLAVRAALLAAAAIAVAGPLIVTPARRDAWNRRVVRAIVTDDMSGGASSAPTPTMSGGAGSAPTPAMSGGAGSTPTPAVGAELAPPSGADQGRPLREQTFAGPSLADGIRRGLLWLESAPPARREIVIVSPLAIGSITLADLAAVPQSVGVRFERAGALPAARTVAAGRRLTDGGVRARDVTLDAARTLTHESAAAETMVWPIDVVVSQAGQPAIDAAVAAVLSQGVWAAPPDRRARLIVGGVEQAGAVADVVAVSRPWMAAAIAAMAMDADLCIAATRVAAGSADRRFVEAPWQVVASAADGRPLVAAAGSRTQLVVASAAPASDLVTPVLLRSIANGIASAPDLQSAEVVPIADAVLQRWSRPALPITSPRIESVERDDRRWIWLAVLCLLGLEAWLRRARPADVARTAREEHTRVA